MTPKQLKWYEEKFLDACGLASLYACPLSVDQFCACHGLEPEDREVFSAYLAKHSIAV